MKMKLVFCIVMFFLVTLLNIQAQTNNDIVIIRVVEGLRHESVSTIVTVTPESTVETIPLKTQKSVEILGENTIKIQQEIIRWQKRGFKIIHISEGGGGTLSMEAERTTIIMMKEEKE